MNTRIVKEFKHMQEKLNEVVRQLDMIIQMRYEDNGNQIADLQEMMIESAYESTLADLGL